MYAGSCAPVDESLVDDGVVLMQTPHQSAVLGLRDRAVAKAAHQVQLVGCVVRGVGCGFEKHPRRLLHCFRQTTILQSHVRPSMSARQGGAPSILTSGYRIPTVSGSGRRWIENERRLDRVESIAAGCRARAPSGEIDDPTRLSPEKVRAERAGDLVGLVDTVVAEVEAALGTKPSS
jgi:hypothetical protein